jgi:hypothetical protein
MRLFPAALLIAALGLSACGGGGLFGKQYEYEEDLTIALDGSATMVVNASIPSLVALRGLALNLQESRIDRDAVRALYESPVASVTRVTRPWRREGRQFVQIRLDVPDIRKLHEAKPFDWSRYEFGAKDGEHVFRQVVGPSALKRGMLPNVGWNGDEVVAFRLHLPSRITFHNSRDLDTNETKDVARGNILGWEQHLADRLDGVPVSMEVRMESESILYRTLWLFAGAFAAALVGLGLMIWWFMRRGAHEPPPTAHST